MYRRERQSRPGGRAGRLGPIQYRVWTTSCLAFHSASVWRVTGVSTQQEVQCRSTQRATPCRGSLARQILHRHLDYDYYIKRIYILALYLQFAVWTALSCLFFFVHSHSSVTLCIYRSLTWIVWIRLSFTWQRKHEKITNQIDSSQRGILISIN